MVTLAEDSGLEVDALGGRPGVRSARFANEGATDGENLDKLRAETPPGSGLRYVCVVAYIEPGEPRARSRAPARAGWRRSPAAPAASATTAFVADGDGTRTMAELSDEEKDRISHRGRAVREAAAWLPSR